MKMKEKLVLLENIPKKKCKYCLTTENLTYDHKNPISRGGSSALGNIQVLCRTCNGIKSSMSNGEVWRVARWIWKINNERTAKGKRPLAISKNLYERVPKTHQNG